MNEQLILIIGGIVTSIISSFTSYIFTKRKYKSEVDSTLIDNMKQSLDFYTTLSNDNAERLEQILNKNQELLELNKELMLRNSELIIENKHLKDEIDTLKTLVKELSSKVDERFKTHKD